MNMTNLAYAENLMISENESSRIKKLKLPENIWKYLVTEMKKVFRFTRKETKWFQNCKTAKLIAAIPFAAGCYEPERTAIAHLCMYVAEIRGFETYCAHLPSDDKNLFKRLDFISTFEGGDRNIIESGMHLLALIMIEGYHKSEDNDKKKGIYNPFVSGAWNYDSIKKKIMQTINTNLFMEDISHLTGWEK